MITHILMGMGAIAGWALFVKASPTRKCGRCRGTLRAASRWNNRPIACPRCRATGRQYRLGAVLVHRLWWRIFADRLADRARKLHERMTGGQS